MADVLDLARERLDMDVALLTEVAEDQELVRASAGEWPGPEWLDGGPVPLEDTFCQRLLEGTISNFVADVAHDERVSDLAMAAGLGVGAWIGVPLWRACPRLYVLCCLSREARPTLDEGDVRLLSGLGETVLARLDPA